MSAANFEHSLRLVLVSEGGYVDNPADPGKATNMGITIATLSAHLGHSATKAEVKALSRITAAAIYRKKYWDAIKGDDLPAGVDYAVFDFAVNSGIKRAGQFLQGCLGVDQDGEIGPATLAAVKAEKPSILIDTLCDRRLAWLKRLSTFKTFGKGWASRIIKVRLDAQLMASAKEVGDVVAMVAPDMPLPKPASPPIPVSTAPDHPTPEPVPASPSVLLGLLAKLWKAVFG